MIGNDKIDRAVAQSFPERLTILSLPNRWTALEFGRSLRNVFGSEMQIMRASFDGQRQAEPLGISEERQRISRRMMNDMDPASGFARKSNHQLHRFVLSFARA